MTFILNAIVNGVRTEKKSDLDIIGNDVQRKKKIAQTQIRFKETFVFDDLALVSYIQVTLFLLCPLQVFPFLILFLKQCCFAFILVVEKFSGHFVFRNYSIMRSYTRILAYIF